MSDEIHAAEKRAEQATDAATKEQILLKQKIKQLETERDSLKSESDKVLVHHESQMQQMRVKLLDANSTIDGLSATIDTLKTELKMAVAQKEAVFGKQADVGVQTAALAPVSIPRSGSAHHVPEPADSVTDTASEGISFPHRLGLIILLSQRSVFCSNSRILKMPRFACTCFCGISKLVIMPLPQMPSQSSPRTRKLCKSLQITASFMTTNKDSARRS
eukprot:TRINITY_DN1890_c0_g1_i16.p1 TRINITY_DN1890_c0_g1~~TRINITY_DN1890_c0_g1_i16.p1  ORF type:complete len:235 (-),score=39.36 TRINITY_DN1890_c0_g1_i16:2166-2819(-)